MFNSKNDLKFVCVFTLLALMLAACSDDASVQPIASQGGTEEETAYVLSGWVGDVLPNVLRIKDSEPISGEAEISREGSIVVIFELDSVTLAKTGRSFTDSLKDDDGHFSFDGVSLQSPYVLVENQKSFDSLSCPTCYRNAEWDSVFAVEGNVIYMEVARAIVDLRKIKKISVNSLTDMKVPLWLKYVAEGMNVDSASDKAESEILEKYGVYESLGAFEEAPDEKSDLPYLEGIAGTLTPYTAYRVHMDLHDFYSELLFVSPELISSSGGATERLYTNAKKMNDYRVGYYAKEKGFGRCTEAREGEMQSIEDYYDAPITIVCRSGKWTLGFKKIDYTKGSMTDPRDGRVYETVTYDADGVSQTWLAENLNFGDASLASDSALKVNLPGHSLCKIYDPDCDLYGRYYSWIGAMGIGENDFRVYSVNSKGDTTFLKQECYDARLMECGEDDSECWTNQGLTEKYCDSLYYGSLEIEGDEEAERQCLKEKTLECGSDKECIKSAEGYCESTYGSRYLEYPNWSYGYVEYMSKKNKDDYQGVCPDGWRIPTLNDWKTLLQIMGKAYGVEPLESVVVLYDDAATGFGMNKVVDEIYVDGVDGWISISSSWWVQFIVADAPLYSLTFYGINKGMPLNMMGVLDSEETNFYTPVYNYYAAFVRCIKK